ncbi:MAG: beta-N-acetylglucosaminidase domain-containing protein, partial [Akkermansia sp.]|nr:beta-N-acetylglucosaminidase domain-containing protein [Akkermansia sp.]
MKLGKEYTRVKEVVIRKRNKKSRGSGWEKLPKVSGAYAITITPGKLNVYAQDDTGIFYAKQTISQLLQDVENAQDAHRDPFPGESLEQVAKKGELPLASIFDWPDLPYRGVVEGYYGIPWSNKARLAQLEFYGRNKLNTYIYAPKDDPYHHGAGCYQLYPADKAAELKKVVAHARKNHVRFFWAIHPANTVNWNNQDGKPQLDKLCAKLQQLYDLGVRDFGVFVDDSNGEIGRAARQV